MKSKMWNKTISAFLAVFVIIGLTAANAGASIEEPPSDYQTSKMGEPIILYYDPNPPATLRVPPPLAFSKLSVQTAHIQINYLAAGETVGGYACYQWSNEAKTAFNYASRIWETLLNSDVTIEIDACWTDMSGNILGGSSANYVYNSSNSSWYQESLLNSITGNNTDHADPDMTILYNRNFDWYYGTDGNTPSGKMDFASVVLHEICHGLGFGGSMTKSGSTGYWGWGYSPDPAIYDRFAENGAGTPLLDLGNGTTTLGSTLTGGNIYFDGTNANAANGGPRPKLYAPGTWAPGSSYSHLDYDTFNDTENELMVWAISDGESIHDPGPITMGMLEDMGWATGVNTAPTISGLPDQTLSMNDSLNNAIDLWAYAEDAESADEFLSFSITNSPDPDAGITIDGDRYIDINPTAGWDGQTDVTIQVTDPGGLSDTDTFKVTVNNTAPTISDLPDQTVSMNGSANHAINLWAYASDAESEDEALTFSIANSPDPDAGVAIDDDHYIDINPETGWVGEIDIEIQVADQGGLSDTDSFHLSVTNTPPTLSEVPDTLAPMNIFYDRALDLWDFAADAEEDVSSLTFTIVNTTVISAGVAISANRYIDVDPSPNYTGTTGVEIRVEDSRQLSDTRMFSLTVTSDNITPTISGLPDQSLWVDTELDDAIDLWAHFRDPEAQPMTYTLLTDILALSSFVSVDGNRYIDITPEAGWVGQLGVTVKATDAGGLFASDSFSVTVAELPTVYLPLVVLNWPPLPDEPVLNPISDPESDGNYTVSWSASDRAYTYTLEEDDNAAFSSPETRYTETGTLWEASGKPYNTYYYRVKASNEWGDSGWSNVESVTVEGWVTILEENFEGTFPGSAWEVHDNNSYSGRYYWGKRNCKNHGGSFSAWSVGTGDTVLSCGSDYPNDTFAWMVYGPFSLADATAAELIFDWWSDTEYNYDTFSWAASTDGEYYYGTMVTGDWSSWTTGEVLDLSDVPLSGNLLGEDQVWIAFIFKSDSTITDKGSFVDNVSLRKWVGAATIGSEEAGSPRHALKPNQTMEFVGLRLDQAGVWSLPKETH